MVAHRETRLDRARLPPHQRKPATNCVRSLAARPEQVRRVDLISGGACSRGRPCPACGGWDGAASMPGASTVYLRRRLPPKYAQAGIAWAREHIDEADAAKPLQTGMSVTAIWETSQPTHRGHTPCVSRRGWRGAAPPLTPAFPARHGSGRRRGAPPPESRRGGHRRA